MPINDIPVWVILLATAEHAGDTIEEAADEIFDDDEEKNEALKKAQQAKEEAKKDPRTPFPSPDDN